MENFAILNRKSSQYGESNDCTVKATAICLETTYEDAHSLLREAGRKPRKGFSYARYIPAMEKRGLTFTMIYEKEKYYCDYSSRRKTAKHPTIHDAKYGRLYSLRTVRELSSFLPRTGRFLVRTSGHVLSFKDGKVEDWTDGRSHRILNIWEVTGEADINPDATITTARHAPSNGYTATYKPRRRRTPKANWKLVRLDTGEVLRTYARRPNKQIDNIARGGYIPTLGSHVKVAIQPM